MCTSIRVNDPECRLHFPDMNRAIHYIQDINPYPAYTGNRIENSTKSFYQAHSIARMI